MCREGVGGGCHQPKLSLVCLSLVDDKPCMLSCLLPTPNIKHRYKHSTMSSLFLFYSKFSHFLTCIHPLREIEVALTGYSSKPTQRTQKINV